MKRAADLLIDTLVAHGVDRVFCVPGESYLSVLDGLSGREDIAAVTARHESGAGFMALADARLTGRPGIAFVSRGPGAMNAAIAVHSSQQDAVPLVLFVGQVERAHRHMGAFQEVDYERVFGSMAKWVVEVRDAARLADTVATAMHAAYSGTPGPVVVALPEDMLEDPVDGVAAMPLAAPRAAASQDDLRRVAAMLAAAQKPLIIAGGLLKHDAGRAALQAVAEAYGVPVAAAVRHADILSNDHPQYAGHLAYGAPAELARAVQQADLVLGVGTRLGDVTTQGYAFPAAPQPAQAVIQVWPDAAAVGHVRRLALGLVADPTVFLADLLALAPERPAEAHRAWSAGLHRVASGLRTWTGPADADDGTVFGAVVQAADRILADDAIVTIDSGNFGGWVQRLMRFGGGRAMLAPSSGAMGYGVPAAVAASLRCPGRQVVCFVGDGGFLMTGNELATAMHSGARPVLIVADNGSYGTIRMHQEKQFPARTSATALHNPDFAALARTYGALGFQVNRSTDIDEALRQALQAGRPAIIAVRTSLQHISAAATIEQLRAHAAAVR
ncbi:thiamine pyrophosphate-dependent enzyme [Bordetella petrii]|uniref:thiamine pyrophosphate-dependent enzyme n=1 Tax=Bordetella petrii TaxID=94624 RepID=UPI001E477EF4|nr:thiamine pyrophosphate-dependent enzyme [Bordetella petrii]MCD0503045.1 thiamine pyrophosphate-dependent enzyme [Bordetella petrii]